MTNLFDTGAVHSINHTGLPYIGYSDRDHTDSFLVEFQ